MGIGSMPAVTRGQTKARNEPVERERSERRRSDEEVVVAPSRLREKRPNFRYDLPGDRKWPFREKPLGDVAFEGVS